MNFNALPMLGRSLSKAVQGSEGNRQNLPRIGSHAKHDLQALEDGDKPDTRAVRVAVCAMTACRGRTVKAIGRNVTTETTAKPLAAAMSFFSARARIGILRIGGPERASCFAASFAGQVAAGAAGRRRVSGVPKADSIQRMKESKARLRADASPRQARSVTRRPDVQDGMTADGGPAGGGKREAAGGRSEQGKRAISARPPPSVRAFSPDARRPPPGGRRKRRHAASVPSTSGAAQRRTLPSPASSRARSLGAEGLACRLASSATGMTSPERLGRTLARGTTTAEGRPRPGAVAPPTTQRSGAGVAAAVTASLARRVRVRHHRPRRDRGIYREPRQRRA